MKSIKKFLFIMVALATALAFVSCSNGSDDGGSSNNSSNNNADNNNDSNNNTVVKPSVVATYESDDGDLELTFLGDGKGAGTWSVVEYIQGNKIIWAQGTFEGFPEKNSTIDITWKEYWDEDVKITKDVSEKNWYDRYSISSGILYFDYLNDYDSKVLFTRQ